MANFKENSKQNWTGDNTIESINAGSLQRIADATEVMAMNHQKLLNELESLKEQREKYRNWWLQEQNKNRALKGHITRLKNKIRFFRV